MNGKVLKVLEYNLTFGNTSRMVNIFGCFRYKANNNLYLVYADTVMKYNIIYYGSSHVKENSILSMECKGKDDAEIIKEYIFKVTSGDQLENFEIISLDTIEGVEIISSNKLEVKPEILTLLTEKTIPKKEEITIEEKTTPKKKSPKTILLLLILVIAIGGGYFLLTTNKPTDNSIAKTITCTKSLSHNKLNAILEEENIYNFNAQNILQFVNSTDVYRFNTEEDYKDFLIKGTYYRYMPDEDTTGGYDMDDEEHAFKIITKETVSTSYNEPTDYEAVLSYYKKEGYTCTENIKKD